MSWLEVAGAQAGVIGRRQLLACRLTERQIERLLAGGALAPVTRGVYRTPSGSAPAGAEEWRAELWSRLLAAGPRSFAWRRSAAAVWDLDGFDAGGRGGGSGPEVAAARGRHDGAGGVRRLAGLRPGDVTRVGEIRVTAPLRTLVDLGTACDADAVERAAECFLRRGLLREADLLAAPRTARGAATLRQVMGRRPPGAFATESDAETRFLQLCRHAGLPEPERQYEVVVDRRYRLDFAWPDVRLGAEVDGREVHGPEALGPDLRRQNRILLAGWLLVRVTWEDVVEYPADTVRTVRSMLAAAALRA